MKDWFYYWDTYFWLWIVLGIIAALIFAWAVPLREFRRQRGLTEFQSTLPETQRIELRERLAEEYEQGQIDETEYRRRLTELER